MTFNLFFIPILVAEIFWLGLMIGYEASKRADPNEPKPKNWEDKLNKRWREGFKAGEKAMAKRMSMRLKDEEIIRMMLEDSDK